MNRVPGHHGSAVAVVVFCFLTVGAVTGPPAARGSAPDLDRSRFIGVDEIRPGMKGYGLSVFTGSRIDTFQVEIIAVRHNYFPQSDMILARGSGAGLERVGIAAGMSGSPIYLDGRLAGALAYGWSFMVTPIMGITPIGDMLALERIPDAPPGSGGGAASAEDRAAWRSLLATRGPGAMDLLREVSGGKAESGPARAAKPIGASLWLSGFDERALDGLSDWLGGANLKPVLSGGESGEAGATGNLDLVPGAAIGVQLVRGDASASAIGTVTWRDGDRVLAFGHPFFHRGRTSFPMTTATIETVMPRLEDSFKYGSAAAPVGSIELDMRAGLRGRMGVPATMIPVTVRINDALAGSAREFHYEVAEDDQLSGAIAAWVTANSVLASGKESGEATLDVATRIRLTDGRELTTRNSIASDFPPGTVASEVARPVGLLLRNPLEKVSVGSIEVDVAVRHRLDALSLEELILASPEARAGRPLFIIARLRNYRGSTIERRITLPLPPDLRGGEYSLRVSDAASFQAWDSQRAPGLYDPATVDQLIRLLAAERPFNTLIATLTEARPSVSALGDDLGRLPPSVLSALAAPGVDGSLKLTQGTVRAREEIVLDGMVEGQVEMKIKVQESPRGRSKAGRSGE